MPRFRDDASRERYEAKIRERLIYSGAHLDNALPRVRDDAQPKKRVLADAVKLAAENGLRSHSYFGKRRRPEQALYSHMLSHWAELRDDVLPNEFGTVVAHGFGLWGVRKAGLKDFPRIVEWKLRCAKPLIDGLHHYAEIARAAGASLPPEVARYIKALPAPQR